MQNPGLGFENGAIWCKLCPETILEQTELTQQGRALAGGSPVAPGHIEIKGSGGRLCFRCNIDSAYGIATRIWDPILDPRKTCFVMEWINNSEYGESCDPNGLYGVLEVFGRAGLAPNPPKKLFSRDFQVLGGFREWPRTARYIPYWPFAAY